MIYRVKPEYIERWPQLSTIVQTHGGGFKSVSLTGKPYTVDTGGAKDGPPSKITVPAATQQEMKLIHESGHPFTEVVDDKSSKEE